MSGNKEAAAIYQFGENGSTWRNGYVPSYSSRSVSRLSQPHCAGQLPATGRVVACLAPRAQQHRRRRQRRSLAVVSYSSRASYQTVWTRLLREVPPVWQPEMPQRSSGRRWVPQTARDARHERRLRRQAPRGARSSIRREPYRQSVASCSVVQRQRVVVPALALPWRRNLARCSLVGLGAQEDASTPCPRRPAPRLDEQSQAHSRHRASQHTLSRKLIRETTSNVSFASTDAVCKPLPWSARRLIGYGSLASTLRSRASLLIPS